MNGAGPFKASTVTNTVALQFRLSEASHFLRLPQYVLSLLARRPSLIAARGFCRLPWVLYTDAQNAMKGEKSDATDV